ncbi:hypothetical protein GCM10009610_15510 [Pseudonocardia xinjiangensis]
MGDSASGRPTSGSARRDRRHSAGSSVLTPPTGMPTVPDLGTAIPAQRHGSPPAPATPPAPPVRRTVVEPCACGHAKAAHDHYRSGTDCGACGATGCSSYRPIGGPIRRTLRRLGLIG